MAVEEFIRYRVPTTSADALEAAYRRAAASLDASAFCIDYAMHHCVEEPERYILRITWTSEHDHLEGFRKSAEFRSFLAEVRPFIEHIEEMQHYAATTIRPRPTI
ncbi:MAG: antibiotic biosynthesis monooxygenase [Myxococcota bacterium]